MCAYFLINTLISITHRYIIHELQVLNFIKIYENAKLLLCSYQILFDLVNPLHFFNLSSYILHSGIKSKMFHEVNNILPKIITPSSFKL